MLALLTNAAQYTPFPPIDNLIVDFENRVGLNMTEYMAWANQSPNFRTVLNLAYQSLNLQVAFLPLIMIFLHRIKALRRFYFLMLICAIAGFSFYYFFPTTAPASVLDSPYFMAEQKATGHKFYLIHHGLPATIEGGMVALPSFHVIWSWLCVDLVKEVRWLFIPLIPLNILLTSACVLLGWHYPTDILGSILIMFLALSYCKITRSQHATHYLYDI